MKRILLILWCLMIVAPALAGEVRKAEQAPKPAERGHEPPIPDPTPDT